MLYSPSKNGFYNREVHGDSIPADAVEITPEQHAALLAGQSAGKRITADANGFPVLQDPPQPTPEQILSSIAAAVQAHMDAAAQAAGYDDVKSAVTYAEEPAVPKFQNEGRAFRAWRSRVWALCYQLLAEVQAGSRPPLTAEEVIAQLPPLELPA